MSFANDDGSNQIDRRTNNGVQIETGDVLKDGRGNEYSVIVDNSGNIEIRLVTEDSSPSWSDV